MEAANIGAREADVAPAPESRAMGWTPADPGPLGLAAFAGTTFMLSLVNAGLVGSSKAVGGGLLPMVAALALAYGGIAQFTAGVWEFRTGNTFGAVALVFLLLAITFIILGIGNSSLAGTLSVTNSTIKLGGWVGLITALVAWYASFAGVINSTFGRVIAPVVPLRR
jgi:succinate-acetate transporter protein